MGKGRTTKILSGGAYIGKDGKRHEWSKIHGYKPNKITDDNWMEYGMPADESREISNESKNMNKKLIRLTEQDLHRIVKESVNKILKEGDFGSEPPYYWSIHKMKRSGVNKGEWECYSCVEDSATSNDASQNEFETPEDAYNDGLKNLMQYTGHYMLEVYYFTPNGAGDYVSGYIAEIHNGKITQY